MPRPKQKHLSGLRGLIQRSATCPVKALDVNFVNIVSSHQAMIAWCKGNISKVFGNKDAVRALKAMVTTPGEVVCVNCKAGYHRTSGMIALFSAMLFVPCQVMFLPLLLFNIEWLLSFAREVLGIEHIVFIFSLSQRRSWHDDHKDMIRWLQESRAAQRFLGLSLMLHA